MKIALCNIAIRPTPALFPPIACTSLCNMLIKAGYDPVFFDIDARRPSEGNIREFFKTGQYDIIGISVVVSTGYRYMKDLARTIKAVSPNTQIILGGNLASAYEIILRKCDIDLCVIGEGEKVLLNLVKYYETHGLFASSNELRRIKGVAFFDAANGCCVYTGSEQLISNTEIPQPDYDLLAKFSNIDQYILDPMTRYDFVYDSRAHEPARRDKKMATIFTSKGCINKCTFCHRWIKGYRLVPVDNIITTIKHLMDKYNVGFFCISDECFGESQSWLEEFITKIKPLDILWQVGGMRVSVPKKDPGVIKRLKGVGLTAVYFGMESGSDKMLSVMEKNATRAENITAAKICAEAGVFTIIQLVIGMPGENDRTIDETVDFIKAATEDLPNPPSVSVNYLQALPGTPSYEYLRRHGFLGTTVEDEERYLLGVSDINAGEFRQYINVSEVPLSKAKMWQMRIQISAFTHWLKKHRWRVTTAHRSSNTYSETACRTIEEAQLIFTPKRILLYRVADIMGNIFWMLLLFRIRYKLYGMLKTATLAMGLTREDDRSRFVVPAESLAKSYSSDHCENDK